MSLYEQLRHFADSYWLVLMMIFFLSVCAWVFRPGSKGSYDAQAQIPLKDDNGRNAHPQAGER